MSASGKITVSVASRVANVDLIHAISDQVATLVGFDTDEILNLGLAVREATINAMKHGNAMNPRKTVRVVFEFGDREMSVAIRDQGRGFALEDVADPTLPENLYRPNGRGLLLMKSFVDRVEVRRDAGKGTEVALFKHAREASAARRRE